MPFKLPDLPYAYDALEPHTSAETLEFHHDKHHAAYVKKLNELLAASNYEGQSLDEICVSAYADRHVDLINNAGQHWNHLFFWDSMAPGGGGRTLPGKVQKLVDGAGGYDELRKAFIKEAMGQFGTGWAWLVIEKSGELKALRTPDGENPLMHGAKPILACDLWEHAWYIDYRDEKKEFVETFFDRLANWEHVEALIE